MMGSIQRAVSEITANGTDLLWWQRLVRRRLVGQALYGTLPNDGTYVMEEDWDILVILDGCRYDLFEEGLREFEPTLRAGLEHRISRGASTRQFIEENFAGEQFMDTVYVTANPFVDLNASECFHDVIPIWESEWNEDEQTVLPEPVYEHTVEAAEQYPDKRIIAHFMQPHYPFVGSSLTEETVTWKTERGDDGESAHAEGASIWNILERGEVSKAAVWEAYLDNLMEGLPYAHRLADELQGRGVITSDHGNGAGEFCWPVPVRAYGHPRNIRIESIVKVPWLVYESDDRREVVAEEPTTDRERQVTDETVDERLENLGYKS